MDKFYSTYSEWYRAADKVCQGIAGVGIEDLPDGPSWDAWNDEVSPREYVNSVLSEEGFFSF